uniref:Cyclin-dependent kinase 2 associated protein 2 n=1 Tax=Sinocyclocheilus grahami TaxID=75366 RepID=A0A672SMZ3_SINGR
MSYKPIAPAPTGSNHTPPGSCGSSPSLASSSNFRPAFSDFGPPSMGFIQVKGVTTAENSSFLIIWLNVCLFEMADVSFCLSSGIIHARALVRECLAETERSVRT